MIDLMNEMIREASKSMADAKSMRGYAHRQVAVGTLTLCLLTVNTNSKNNVINKTWKLNGKKISADKVTSM